MDDTSSHCSTPLCDKRLSTMSNSKIGDGILDN